MKFYLVLFLKSLKKVFFFCDLGYTFLCNKKWGSEK